VAVVQISRIQVRRGQKNTGSGLPQLASGELGWAIDTRELYIGNGAVSEGSPAVGNTKILTAYDDLFSLADSYTYSVDKSYVLTGPDSSNATKRTLQERLDDRVSVRSFGAKGDGVTNDTVALQRALDQLYLNSATKGSTISRVELHLEAGTYVINDTLYVPPYASLIGSGSGKTVISSTVNKPIFITVNSNSTPGAPASDSSSTSLTQATDILLRGMSLKTIGAGAAGTNNISSNQDADTAKCLVLQSCKDSVFDDITFEGVWVNGAAVDQDNAVVMNNLSGVVASDNNTFSRCNFLGFGTAVRSNWDSDDNTFDQCKFETLGHAFIYGKDMILGNEASGKSRGPSYNTVSRSMFNNIHRETIRVVNGENNISKRNKFVLCGNNGSIDTIPMFSIIKYEKDKNKSFEDYFSRTYALSSGSGLDSVPYYPEVEGSAFYKTEFENVISIGQVSNVRAFRLPGVANQAYEIDYTLVSENYRHIRSGTIHVVVDAYGDNVEISDDYHYTGDEAYLESIEFNVLLRDVDLDLTQETIDVIVTSTMPTDDATQMKYTVTAKKTNVI
jgi:hypothetical protein